METETAADSRTGDVRGRRHMPSRSAKQADAF